MSLHITSHAIMRWAERFGRRFVMSDILDEFRRAEKWKPNKVRRLGIRIDYTRRYYVTELCIFVVAADTRSIVTVLPRRR